MSEASLQRGWSPGAVVLAIIAGTLILRLALAALMGFSFDEAYNVVMSRHVDLGYVDHPPLTMWLIRLSTLAFGNEGTLAVRLPGILLFAGTTWLIYLLTWRLFGAWPGVYAATALNLAPLFSAYVGTIAITDGPMLFGLAFGMLCLAAALFPPDNVTRWAVWLAAGAGFGVALLAKFTAILVLPALLVFFLTDPRQRRWLTHPAPYAALAVALVVLAPPIVWNVTHDFVAFRFQGERAAFDGAIHPIRTITFLVILSVIFLPVLWAGLVAAVGGALRAGPSDAPRWYLAWLSVGPIVFFPLVWLFGANGTSGYHWAAPGYLLAFPLLGAWVERLLPRWRWWIKWWTIGSIATVLAILVGFAAHIATGWMRTFVPAWNTYDPVVADQADWWDLRAALASRGLLDPERVFIVSDRWEDCAKIAVVIGDTVPIVCATSNPIRLEFARDQTALLGRDAVFVTKQDRDAEIIAAYGGHFAGMEPLGTVTMTTLGLRMIDTHLILGRGLRTPLPLP